MYRPRGHHNGGSDVPIPAISSPETAQAADVLEKFIAASTFKSVLHHHRQICDLLKLRPTNMRQFYPKLRAKLKSWKAQALWAKFDKRASHKCYNHGKACANTKVLIIGAGPCGLRTAIEAQLLGAQVVVVEKRDRFSRNNVLHLWPFVITDLKALGAKKFYGKFCAGSIDHISIRQVQCILLKVALLLGVRIFEGLGFEELLPPPQDQTEKIGWRARFSQPDHSLHQYEFDVLIGADGKRNTLPGFKRTEFRGKLAIAVTANFINKRSEGESSVQEISGVAFIFNQKFFKELKAATGIDLENIVYYKDETHYFVMTAKKQSLIDKNVIIEDLMDTQQLLHPNNVNREALQNYAREAADFSTNYQMPHLDFAVNHYGHPDVAMFDFTSMFAAENACRAHQVHGHRLLMGLVGDSLLEPFWPTGSGCARGFLSAFDAAWMMRSWALAGSSANPLDVLAERESIFRLLAQTTPRNLSKDLTSYTLEPCSRYPTINTRAVLPFQVRQLFTTDDPASLAALMASDPPSSAPPHARQDAADDLPRKRKRRDSLVDPGALLNWCQRQVSHLPSLSIDNMTTSFKDGLALCGILHRYRPEVVPFEELSPDSGALNNQLAFDILETEFGVPPLMTGVELSEGSEPDKLSMISYLSQIHHVLRGEVPHVRYEQDDVDVLEECDALPAYGGPRGITCRVRDEPLLVAPAYDRSKKYKTERGITPEGGAEPPSAPYSGRAGATAVDREDFDDRVKYLEAKFKGEPHQRIVRNDKKPKDMVRAIGRLEKGDWNVAAIERKIEENPRHAVSGDAERVPNWNKQAYEEKMNTIERRLRANGEKEETIAKYKDVDAYLKRLEKKLREGSTLDVGLKGNNKVSNLASQLSSKLTHPNTQEKTKTAVGGSSKAPVVVQLPTTSSDLCYFCGTRVYLAERLSAEGKFFHRHCFKCHYCNALLRLGNYIYDREGRYGGKFFCIPHFGLTVPTGPRRGAATTSALTAAAGGTKGGPTMETPPPSSRHVLSKLSGGAVRADMEDRGTTPERVEFENSLVEQGSDEEDYLSEEEWTDRNFGASANELDDTSNDSEDDSDSEEEDGADGDQEEEAQDEAGGAGRKRAALTKPATATTATNWNTNTGWRGSFGQDSDSDLDSDDYSEECGAEGDESHTATEGEGEGDEDDDGGEEEQRQRERRKQEIKHTAPPKRDDTSDTASDTEIGSDSSESDTQIDTDSEFGEEDELKGRQREIPMIVIDVEEDGAISPRGKKASPSVSGSPRDGAEKSASLTSLADLARPPVESAVSPVDQLRQRLLQRTESNEALTSQKNLLLRRQYLLGQGSSLPKKSVSTADLGNRFKSFMEKISETQKMLHPAPQPSPAMQAYINSSSAKTSPVVQSPVASGEGGLSDGLIPTQPQDASFIQSNLNKTLANESTTAEKAISFDVEAENFRNSTMTRSNPTPNNKNVKKTEKRRSPEKDDEINFGEADGFEEGSKTYADTDTGILLLDSSNPDQNINRLDFIVSNSESAVETINEELLRRSSGGTTEFVSEQPNVKSPEHVGSSAAHLSLQSAPSVPSDVDDLFEILARDAQDDAGNFLSFNSAMEEVAPSLSQGIDLNTSANDTNDLCPQTYDKERTSQVSTVDSLRNEDPGSDVVVLSPPVSPLITVAKGDSVTSSSVVSDSPELKQTIEAQHRIKDPPQLVEISSELLVDAPSDKNGVINEQVTVEESQQKPSVQCLGQRSVARVASVESLGDTDSAMSVATVGGDSQRMPRLPPGPPPLEEEESPIARIAQDLKPSNTLSEMDAIEFMDSDGEEASDARKRNSLALSDDLLAAKPYTAHEVPLKDVSLSLNTSSSTPSKDTSPKGEISYQNIVNQTLDSMSPVSTTDNIQVLPRLAHYTPLAEAVSSSTEDSSYSATAPGFTSTPVSHSQHPCDVKAGDDGLGCSAESQDNVLFTDQKSIPMGEGDGSGTILPTPKTKSLSGPADRRSRLRQGSDSSPSDDVTETDDSSSNINSSESKEDSSISQVSSSSRKFSGSDGSKEALLSSPELVKNAVYQSEQSTLLNRTTPINNSSLLDDNTPVQVNSAKSSPRAEKDNLVSPTKRYEGYIPRFKDHLTPFTRIRDTLDIRKDNKLPQSSPSKEETAQNSLDEKSTTADSGIGSGMPASSGSVSTTLSDPSSPIQFTTVDNAPALRKIEKNVLNTKKKDGDVVQQLVLSRISRKTPDKLNRRGSRPTLSPLNSSENLLESNSNIASSCEHSSDSNLLNQGNGECTSSCTPDLDRSTTSLSERVLVEPSQRYTPKFSQYSPIEARISRTRANTVSAITRDSKTVSLVNLPATPLTHPHQFENLILSPKKLFASPAPSVSASNGASSSNGFSGTGSQLPAVTPNKSIGQLVDATPVSAVISGLDLERSHAREKARSLVKLKSDFDLGLSPPHVPPAVVTRLHLSEQSEERKKEAASVDKIVPLSHSRDRNDAQKPQLAYVESEAPVELAVLSDRAKEDRVRKLLAEQRARDVEVKQHHARENRDEKVAEKLQQFRVRKDKKSQGTPTNVAVVDSEESSVRQLTSRPSLLELESMQVFSKPVPALAAVVPVGSYRDVKLPASSDQGPATSAAPQGPVRVAAPSTVEASLVRPPPLSVVTPPLSTSTPLTPSPPPLTPSQIYGSKSPPPPKTNNERKHKSKDRERRRSLIQVFAGMFKSSGGGEERREGDSPSSSGASSPPSLTAPKSPATAVRDKLARLRLPRTKDSKGGKKRSSSSEVLAEPTNNDARLALSLPTSPAHHTTSVPTLPPAPALPPHASGPGCVAAGHPSPAHDTPRIEEESLTDDESSSRTTPRSPPRRGSGRAADTSREAELKRLRQAQEIQRQLEECEVKTRDLEERGVMVEKSLRGEPGGEHREETDLMSEWFRLVHEKNGLARWEQELSIRARELELEDRDARLQQQLASRGGTAVEKRELLSIREQREHLRAMLEEDRLRYVEEDRDLEGVMLRKGLPLPAVRRETGV